MSEGLNLLDLDLAQLEEIFISMGEAKFRAKQVFMWLHKGVGDFGEMRNLPKTLIEKLRNNFNIHLPQIVKFQESKIDGTRKYLFRLEDGNVIESVFMKYKFGNSICISSQVGCRMGCKFCASTIGGLRRNMTPAEMLGQVLMTEKDTGEKISHIVVMGTGEPFDNYENLSKFLKLVNSKDGLNIGMRNITVSTCGVVPMIENFSKDFPQVNLAISLHQVDDENRSKLMPINKVYPIGELIETCKKYTANTSRRITFEYTLVRGENDTIEHSRALGKLLKGMLCHVNLIPLNEVKETGLKTSNREAVLRFQEGLKSFGIPVTIRREMGDDIDGACGQLRLNGENMQNMK